MNARHRTITGPLTDSLEQLFPGVRFGVDDEAAMERPGEQIKVSWEDGPTRAAVLRALAPRWSDNGTGYPVQCLRVYSPHAIAVVLLELHQQAALSSVTDMTRQDFAALVDQRLTDTELPAGVDGALWARARLLASIAETLAGRDAYTWAWWLSVTPASGVLSEVLPAALGDTPQVPLPD